MPDTNSPDRFPLDEIADVVIRLRYTAKTDNGSFREQVKREISKLKPE